MSIILFLLLLSSSHFCLVKVADSTSPQQQQQQQQETNAPSTLISRLDDPNDNNNNNNQPSEIQSFKAIKTLHSKLDVDADGEVDDFESKKFLESDKIKVNNNNAGAYSTAHKLRYLHQDGKDRSISVDELWEAWKSSHVHNWTVDETVYWLVNYVELPEYSQLFEQHSVNGSLLPRLATDSHFLSGQLGITDPSAKSKISIKAMDVVLFGPPKLVNASKARDIIVAIITLIAISSCYVLYSRNCATQKTVQTMQDQLESLQRAEQQWSELQRSLEEANQAREAVVTEKRNLEHQLEMQRQYSATNIAEQAAANHISNNKKFTAPLSLRNLLQTTYNIESHYYNEKKLNLECRATEVKLRNQKLQKKKTSFLGYYKMAQENSLEEDINAMKEIKEAIMQITIEIKERTDRWRAIGELCGFNFVTNQTSTHPAHSRQSS